MDLSSTLIGLGILLLFIGPIILLIINQNRKTNSHRKQLMKFAQENDLRLSVFEIDPSILIGFDNSQKKIIYTESSEKNKFHIINLKEITQVKIQTIDFPEREGKMNFISLIFSGKTQTEKQEMIFYDENIDAVPDSEVQYQLAKKWHTILQNHI